MLSKSNRETGFMAQLAVTRSMILKQGYYHFNRLHCNIRHVEDARQTTAIFGGRHNWRIFCKMWLTQKNSKQSFTDDRQNAIRMHGWLVFNDTSEKIGYTSIVPLNNYSLVNRLILVRKFSNITLWGVLKMWRRDREREKTSTGKIPIQYNTIKKRGWFISDSSPAHKSA